jgi:chromosome segregation ATPase
MNDIEKQFKELRQQIVDLSERLELLEHKDDHITIYESLYLLNSEDLEKNLKSLVARIKELTMKLGRIEITISDTP